MERIDTWRELGYLISQDLKQNNKSMDKRKLSELIKKETEDVKLKELWKKLIEKNKRYYDNDKYLELEVYKGKVRRVPLPKGRPQSEAEQKKDKRITIRLNKELESILNKYCQTNNKKESEVLRELIQSLRYK